MKVKVIKKDDKNYNKVLEVEKIDNFYFQPETLSMYNLYECVNWECEVTPSKELKQETIKFDEGKPCISDIPQLTLMSVAKVFNYGAKKYSKFNYSAGTQWLRYYDATQRHLNSWMVGDNIDESTCHHLDHAIASLMMLRENIHLNKGTDDRNKIYKGKI